MHINSGVQNFFFYLLSNGGTGTNNGRSYHVTGISITNATKIAFRVLAYYSYNVSGFSSVADGWESAARDLNTNWVNSVQAAWAAVGIGETPPNAIGPTIRANGAAGEVIVNYPEPVSITAEMNAGNYAGADVDWWVVAFAHSGQWYYLNSATQWTSFSGNLALCRPIYQGALSDLSSTRLLDRFQLSRGTYDFWFAVDFPMDGILNTSGPILYDKVTVVVQ